MTLVSLLMPAWKFPGLDKLTSFVMDTFSQAEDNIEYFEIVPVSREKLHACKNVAVKFKSSDFNLMNLESLTTENKHLKVQLDRAKETIRSLSHEYSTVFANSSQNKEAEQQKAVKRAKKIKQLDEENKKLKSLLRNQLENSEKLRTETQITIETLKEEFELLVKELSQLQKRSADSTQGSSLSFEGKSYNLFGSNKPSDFVPKLDRMEMLLSNQQG